MSLVPATAIPSVINTHHTPVLLNPTVVDDDRPPEPTERKIIRRGESGARTLGFVAGLAGGYALQYHGIVKEPENPKVKVQFKPQFRVRQKHFLYTTLLLGYVAGHFIGKAYFDRHPPKE